MAVMDALAEDDGPVVLERRRSRHGNYYEEIPPEPEPTPVPVVPEHVPEAPGLVHVQIGEPVQVLTLGDYAKALEGSNSYGLLGTIAPGQWHPTTDATMFTSTSGYSISLNDVIGAGKVYQPVSTGFGSIEGVFDPEPANAIMDAALKKKCGHVYIDIVGPQKFSFNKSKPGGMSYEPVQCKDCGKQFTKVKKF